ncbi:DNA-3-methyladenine glycosylase family protein [Moheibacter sediminis]|uniref:DNA-3-methyladenine glycosylase II n=1 Tax=Moheibacter sediminis TaxID=1434700 RepID=A0A1W1ZNU9_9FLAO|nr:DNA-3-methyladenine glycosylase [Moheibacter sediminis]SMC50215.1 DNA-3-methyladenine glycosylase II [Moheibacter sediminis]
MDKIVNQKDLDFLLEKDEIIREIYALYGAPPNWERSADFISLSKIILEQQVSLASAKAHFERLNGYIKSFSPENILLLSDEEMRNCHISWQKAKYLRNLSVALVSGELVLEELIGMDEPTVRKKLISIKGIGNWTADVYLLFCLQHKDIFPIGDIAVVNTIKALYEVTSHEEILEVAVRWQPCRSLATYFMWHHYLCKRGKTAVY